MLSIPRLRDCRYRVTGGKHDTKTVFHPWIRQADSIRHMTVSHWSAASQCKPRSYRQVDSGPVDLKDKNPNLLDNRWSDKESSPAFRVMSEDVVAIRPASCSAESAHCSSLREDSTCENRGFFLPV